MGAKYIMVKEKKYELHSSSIFDPFVGRATWRSDLDEYKLTFTEKNQLNILCCFLTLSFEMYFILVIIPIVVSTLCSGHERVQAL